MKQLHYAYKRNPLSRISSAPGAKTAVVAEYRVNHTLTGRYLLSPLFQGRRSLPDTVRLIEHNDAMKQVFPGLEAAVKSAVKPPVWSGTLNVTIVFCSGSYQIVSGSIAFLLSQPSLSGVTTPLGNVSTVLGLFRWVFSVVPPDWGAVSDQTEAVASVGEAVSSVSLLMARLSALA